MTRFLYLAAPLLIVSAPAFAQEASTGAVAASSASSGPVTAKPKKVCRKFAVTGKRIAKSTCYTADQWAELDRRNEQNAKVFIDGLAGTAGKANLGSGGDGSMSTNSIFGLGPSQ